MGWVMVPDNEMASVRFIRLWSTLRDQDESIPQLGLMGLLVQFWGHTRREGMETVPRTKLPQALPVSAARSGALIEAMLECGYLEAQGDLIHVVDNTGLEAKLIKRREDGAAAGRKSAATRSPSKRKTPKPKEEPTEFQLACKDAWSSYANAYAARFGQPPTANAKVRRLVQMFVERVGRKEASDVLTFYVYHPSDFYMQRGYQLDHAVRDAESLRTQWANGKPIVRQAVAAVSDEYAYQEQQRQIQAGLI